MNARLEGFYCIAWMNRNNLRRGHGTVVHAFIRGDVNHDASLLNLAASVGAVAGDEDDEAG